MNTKMRRGNHPGSLVTDYPIGMERPYMINHYGGRVVALNLSEEDITDILYMQDELDKTIQKPILHASRGSLRISAGGPIEDGYYEVHQIKGPIYG